MGPHTMIAVLSKPFSSFIQPNPALQGLQNSWAASATILSTHQQWHARVTDGINRQSFLNIWKQRKASQSWKAHMRRDSKLPTLSSVRRIQHLRLETNSNKPHFLVGKLQLGKQTQTKQHFFLPQITLNIFNIMWIIAHACRKSLCVCVSGK